MYSCCRGKLPIPLNCNTNPPLGAEEHLYEIWVSKVFYSLLQRVARVWKFEHVVAFLKNIFNYKLF